MRKKLKLIKPVICLFLCLLICILVPCIAPRSKEGEAEDSNTLLNIWQIDSFEGGKGSRADYLQNLGNSFYSDGGCIVTVTSISSDAARLNLAAGNCPDLVSYGVGTYGIESYIEGYTNWCSGGYCLLSLNGDFSDVTIQNTVINEGKDNLVSAAAMFCGINGAKLEKTTGAYVKLINGEFKYLLGTQRDIYRLKTRGVSFSVNPVTQFNDLYQNISIASKSENKMYAQKFIDYVLSKSANVSKLGMISAGTLYDDEMNSLQGIEYDYKLTTPVSEELYKKLENIINDGDINMLKNLLK